MSGPVHCVVIIVYMADASRIVWGALTSPVSVRRAGGISWDSSGCQARSRIPGAESQGWACESSARGPKLPAQKQNSFSLGGCRLSKSQFSHTDPGVTSEPKCET